MTQKENVATPLTLYTTARIPETKTIYGNAVWKIASGGYHGAQYRLPFYIETLLWLLESMTGKGKDDNKRNKKTAIWDVAHSMKDT